MAQNGHTIELSEALLGDLSSLTDEASRLKFLTQQQLCSPAVAQQLIEAARTSLRIDPQRSLSLAEAATIIATSLSDEGLLGPSLRAKANALHVLGDNQSALAFHEQALALFRRRGNREEEARTLNASIQPCILLGSYDRALQSAMAARDIFRELGDNRRLAYVELNVGNLYHRQDRFEDALACYERAYEMFLPFADSEGLGVALYNISVSLISLNDFPRALASYQRAREMFVRHGMSLLVAQADYNIAYLYYLRGEYGRAISMLRAAHEQSEINGDAHIRALCYLDLSDVYLELNLSGQASEMAHEGARRFKILGMGYEQAKCLANEAIAWSQQGKPLHALDLFSEARSIFVRENNLSWPSLIDLYSALAYFAEGRLFEAQRFCKKALEFFETSTLPGKAVLCHLLLARIELQNGDSSSALRHAEDALVRLDGRETPILEYQAHYFMGLAHSRAGNEEEAYLSFQKAREELETLRFKIRKEELKIPFVKEKSAVYEHLIQICLDREGHGSSLPEIFKYIELTKRRSMAEMILDEMQEVPRGIVGNSELVRRIRELREELNWYDHRIEIVQLSSDQAGPEKVGRLEAEARAREEKLVQILRELPDTAPEARLFRPAEILPLEAIQASVPPRVSFIEYFAVGDELLASVVTRKQMQILPVTMLPRLLNLVSSFRAHMSRLRFPADDGWEINGKELRVTQDHLQSLYSELLEPLTGHVSGEHLVFIPHGFLHCIPFHALFDGHEYVIDRFAVSHAPSGSLCARRHDDSARHTDSRWLLCLGRGEPSANYPEASGIAAAMNSPRLLFGEIGMEEALRGAEFNPRWIHVANQRDSTHGELLHNTRFRGSCVTLAGLFHRQHQPDLVSLSGFAHQLDLDAAAAGEDLAALQRCLLEGGAKAVISELWEVRPSSSIEFLKSLSSHLTREQSGVSKAKIFQATLHSLRKHLHHPAHWAPFFLAESSL